MQFLNAPTASATAIFLEVKNLLGPAFIAWEPETIYLELHEKTGIDPDALTRDKLQACITVLLTTRYYDDAAVFENVTTAFNHYISSPDILHEASPAQMAWAVTEVGFLRAMHSQSPLVFDYEPQGYAAVCLFRDGYVLAPKQLAFAQDQLDKLLPAEAAKLQKEVSAAWDQLRETSLDRLAVPNDSLGTQLGRLALVELYVQNRARQLTAELKALQR